VFGVSLPELIVIFVVVLLVFGPDKLPEIARSFGKWTGDFRRTSDSLRREFYHSVYNPVDSARRELTSMRPSLQPVEESRPAAPESAPPPSPSGTPSTDEKKEGA
jgi:sec-independent protein translocase protein TatA